MCGVMSEDVMCEDTYGCAGIGSKGVRMKCANVSCVRVKFELVRCVKVCDGVVGYNNSKVHVRVGGVDKYSILVFLEK